MIWQNGSALGLIDSSQASDYRGFRLNLDHGPIGNYDFDMWAGGDVEPTPDRATDGCFDLPGF